MKDRTTSYVVIPARLASTRLPRKLLLRETGKSLLQHTYESARRATRPAGLCVACDHQEIYDEVRSFGGQVQMTDPNAACGRALVLGTRSYNSVATILKNHRENAPTPMAEAPVLIHENIRGPGYYH